MLQSTDKPKQRRAEDGATELLLGISESSAGVEQIAVRALACTQSMEIAVTPAVGSVILGD